MEVDRFKSTIESPDAHIQELRRLLGPYPFNEEGEDTEAFEGFQQTQVERRPVIVRPGY